MKTSICENMCFQAKLLNVVNLIKLSDRKTKIDLYVLPLQVLPNKTTFWVKQNVPASGIQRSAWFLNLSALLRSATVSVRKIKTGKLGDWKMNFF